MSALNNFQAPGDSIPKLFLDTSTSTKLDIGSSTYQTMFSMDDTLVATICRIVDTKGRIPHVPHCGRVTCKLLAGCDIVYNPYNDPCGAIGDDDRRQEIAYEPYKSPFQREVTIHSPKKRKLSDDSDKSSEGQPADRLSTSSEPAGPFSERSWLALELLVIMNWTNPDCPGHIIVDGLLKIMPGLDLKECFALDMLRVTYPVPNIYDDDDEDESTDAAKIHKLHEKVWHMPPEYLTPRMNEIYWRLMQLGHLPDLVLMPPSQDWDPSLNIVALIDEPGYNYCFVGGDNILYYISARFTLEDMEPGTYALSHIILKRLTKVAQLQISLEEHQEDEHRKLKKRNNTRNLYHDRLNLHGIRNEAAMEAIRMVHELRCDPSTTSRIQVEAVRLNYERRGLPWHWKFSPTIGQIEPEVFAHWVDKLDNEEFAYALTPIRDWAIAGIKLGKALKARGDTYSTTTNGHVADNPFKAPVGELSPGKRPYSEVSWDTEDEEIPSNSPPPDEADILRSEQQRIIGLRGMTEDDLLQQVLEQSMNDVGGDRHMDDSTPIKQTKPVPVIPEPADEQPEDSMTIEEIDELMERSFEWGLSMSCDPNLGPFPKKEVTDEIKSKRPQRHASLAKIIPRVQVQQHHRVPHPSIEMLPSKANVAVGGLDGVKEQLPLLTSLVSGSFPESFERGSKSRPPPSDTAGLAKYNRMKVNYIVDAVSHARGNIPPAESSSNPHKEIVAKAARDNGLIDMETYQSISNKDSDRENNTAQKYLEWLHRPSSPPHESIDIVDQKHADRNKRFFRDGYYVPGLLIPKAPAIRMKESEQSEDAVAVHVEEVGEDDHDENPPPQQRRPTADDIALRVLSVNKQRWLKEDEEYKRIASSERSLSEHLAQDDVPLSRRSNAMVSVVIRDQEQREAWILKKARLKARISLPVLSACTHAFARSAAAARAPSPSISMLSDDSMSSYATAQEGDAEVGKVARGLAIAVKATPRPSNSATAAAGMERIAAEETKPLPFFEKTKSNRTTVPIANMEFRGRQTSLSNSASSDGGVSLGDGGVSVVPEVHGKGSSSPIRNEVGFRSHSSDQSTDVRLRDAVSEVRKTLAQVEVIPESPREDGAADAEKVPPDVEMVELSPVDIAKEA